jgi:uncharacterized membrane protein
MNQVESPKHNAVRNFLRIVGPTVAVIGLIFTVVGMARFFSAFGSFQPPRLFWCAFVGLPLIFVGLVMSKFGYIGSVARYLAGESAPVTKDTVNYMVEGAKDAVKTVARAVAEGVQEAEAAKKARDLSDAKARQPPDRHEN